MKITKPTFVIDETQCRRNIEKINSKALAHNLTFRPHFKTHQSTEVGKFFSDFGINKITVSSVAMAEYFMEHGWNDITIAFPVNILEIDSINVIAKKITLNLLVVDESSLDYLDKNLTSDVNIFIEVDTGYHRSGIASENILIITSLIKKCESSTKLNFSGFLTHAGHTYNAKSKEEVLAIHDETIKKMNHLKSLFADKNPIISIGDTPSCSLSNNYTGIDEIRPGNVVYYDLTQSSIGSCDEHEISVILAAPIVDIHKERNEVIIFGGGVHLSKEYLNTNQGQIYGKIVLVDKDSWSDSLPDCFVKKLSQEHGIVHIGDNYIDRLKIGDIIGILPIHSCMTANLMKENTLII